ncbi:hypothetical protein BDQ17DRAFT_1351229 [Cyathus striatus]|nr:hypothetical protein BDQ17DRAFT_1351229 [Cyathus striatus]
MYLMTTLVLFYLHFSVDSGSLCTNISVACSIICSSCRSHTPSDVGLRTESLSWILLINLTYLSVCTQAENMVHGNRK